MPTREKYLKVAFFLKKKPGVSDEEFHSHWEGVHKDLPQRIPEFMKVVKRYQQVSRIPLPANVPPQKLFVPESIYVSR